MDFWRKIRLFIPIFLYTLILVPSISAEIFHQGYLNASQQVSLSLDDLNPENCNEYVFMTNYKQGYFDLITTPSSKAGYDQRIILSDMPFKTCPHKWSEEPNYCKAISNRIFSETQGTFSKCFPALYVYIINQRPIQLGFEEFLEDLQENSLDSDLNIIIESFEEKSEFVHISKIAKISDSLPVFTLTPSHLNSNCRTIDNILPKWASLSNKECINQAFCTTECGLLTCQSETKEKLFSICTGSNLKEPDFISIWSDHAKASLNYEWAQCDNPLSYNDSLTETEVSIFLIFWAFMTLLVSCACCYNLRLIKTGEAPCEVCPLCPECLFPREVEDDDSYIDSNNSKY